MNCCDSDVKLLWVASDNKPEGYIKGFKVAKPLNLVMAIIEMVLISRLFWANSYRGW